MWLISSHVVIPSRTIVTVLRRVPRPREALSHGHRWRSRRALSHRSGAALTRRWRDCSDTPCTVPLALAVGLSSDADGSRTPCDRTPRETGGLWARTLPCSRNPVWPSPQQDEDRGCSQRDSLLKLCTQSQMLETREGAYPCTP